MIVGVRKILLDPPNDSLFTVFFDCEENGVEFLMISKCILTDFRLSSWGAPIFWGDPKKSIPGFVALKERGCLVRISSKTTVDSIISVMKEKVVIKKREQRARMQQTGIPATKEQKDDALARIFSDEYKDWYERAKSQES